MHSRRFYFEASRRLRGGPLHDRQYTIEVITSEDCGDLAAFAEYVRERCDRRHLNNQFQSFDPSVDNLARHFYHWIAGTQPWPLLSVRVRESAEYIYGAQ